MITTILSTEIKELEILFTIVKRNLPHLEKELEQVIKAENAAMAMVYSRRCLEIVITELCENLLNKQRKAQSFEESIDSLTGINKVPSDVIQAMHALNAGSGKIIIRTKEIDAQQVKPALKNLAILLRWYLGYKHIQIQPVQTLKEQSKHQSRSSVLTKNRKLLVNGAISILVILIVVFVWLNLVAQNKEVHGDLMIEKSIAVLPLKDLSPAKDQAYFCDGLAGAILDHLSKTEDLKIIANASSMRYKNSILSIDEIARELNVKAILTGDVQKIENRIKVNFQLMDPFSGFQLWSATYDKDVADIFIIQTDVAENVAKIMQVSINEHDAALIQNKVFTKNRLAYDFYLKGNEYYSQGNHLIAMNMYSKAIVQDSQFAAAYAKRAILYMTISTTKDESWQGYKLKAQEDIKKAFRLNPGLSEVKLARAIATFRIEKDYDKALIILKELKKTTPQLAEVYANISYVLRRQGKWEESNNEMLKAIEMDPFNAYFMNELAHTYRIMHKYDNEINTARNGLDKVPDFQRFKEHIFFGLLFKNGNLNEALKESGIIPEKVRYTIYYYNRQFPELIEFIKNDSILLAEDQFMYMPKSFKMAFIYYLIGNKTLCNLYADSAIAIYKQKIKEDPSDERYWAYLGKSYAFIGKKKEAIACGEKAIMLKPLKQDALQGINKMQDLMEIYTYTGNFELAMDKIEYLSGVPGNLHYGDLALNPIYDKLRNSERFQKLLKSIKKAHD
ncbi:MAG: hypothetical protein U0W24_02335 [Bacteroidales bacterium]